ncbi:MAG: PEP-CTERM sorting domain-containing protein [Armatimonas sp.]
MNFLRRMLPGLAVVGLALVPTLAQAQVFNLDPGSELVNYSNSSNDAYSDGRGTVFTANTNFNLTSAGLWTNPLGSFTYTWNLYLVTEYPGGVNNELLGTTTVTPTDTGLGFYDATFSSPISLVEGNRYHIEVTYTGEGEENWFYDFNQGSVNLGGVTVEDGTSEGDTGNTVMPLIRLNAGAAAPEPGSLALLALGCATAGFGLKRRRIAH